MKIKIGGLSLIAGATILASIAWHNENNPLFWVWWIIAMPCVIATAIHEELDVKRSAGYVFKVKILVLSALVGATLFKIGHMTYHDYTEFSPIIQTPQTIVLGIMCEVLILFAYLIVMVSIRGPNDDP